MRIPSAGDFLWTMNLRAPKLALIFIILASSWNPAFGKTFTDVLGRQVTLNGAPERIVPLAPSLTEILYFIGLGDRVVGVTNHCNYPKEAALKPKVGSYVDLNVEKIIDLSPQLVIGTIDGNSRSLIDLLDQAGIKVYLVNPRNVMQAIETIEVLGEVCGVPERANDLSFALRKRVNVIKEKIKSRGRPKVFLEIHLKPIMTVNRNTFHHDLIRLAGGVNLFQDEPITYPRISLEEVIRREPEVILISSMERGGTFETARRAWLKWTSIPAVRNGRVYLIDSDIIDRPSPRIVEGLEQMARFIHPDVSWD